jgi:hypothetical protein
MNASFALAAGDGAEDVARGRHLDLLGDHVVESIAARPVQEKPRSGVPARHAAPPPADVHPRGLQVHLRHVAELRRPAACSARCRARPLPLCSQINVTAWAKFPSAGAGIAISRWLARVNPTLNPVWLAGSRPGTGAAQHPATPPRLRR